MKKMLTALLLLAGFASNAQSLTTATRGTEQPRRQLRPYATVDEAAADSREGSRYIVPVTGWQRSEADGLIRFTAQFVYPSSWLNRQLLVRVGSASSGYRVEIGGREAGSTTNGAAPAEFNVTKLSQTGQNTIEVILEPQSSNEPLLRAGTPRLGSVEIVSQPTVRVRDIETRTTLNDAGDGVFEVAIAVKTEALNTKQARVSYELAADDRSLASGYKDLSIGMRSEDTVRFVAVVPRALLWSPESPSLLTLTLRNRIEGRYAENIVVPVGVREVKYEDKTLYVNGQAERLKARNVAPDAAESELRQLREAGVNAVTVDAGASAAELWAACDRVGLYAIAGVGVDTSAGDRSIAKGGNACNDPELTDEYIARTWAAYHTSKSHPSVVAFALGHGITNGINAYESYLLLKSLDPYRPVIFDGAGREWNNDPFDLSF